MSGKHKVSSRHRRGVAAAIACALAGYALLAHDPSPTPHEHLATALASHPGTRISVFATGVDGATNPRIQSDGTLLLDARADAMVYRIKPRHGGGADVWLVARELEPAPDFTVHEALGPGDTHFEFVPERGELRVVSNESPPVVDTLSSSSRLARRLDRIHGLESVLAPDATIYVVSSDSGIVYRILTQR